METTAANKAALAVGVRKTLELDKFLLTVGVALLRYGIVFLLVLWGTAKWTRAEAIGIQPWMSHSPLTSWLYNFMSVQGASIAIGVVELTLAAMIASRRFLPRVSGWGSALSGLMFLTTLSFLVSGPQLGPVAQGFLLKDLVSFGAVVYTAGEAFQASRRP